MDDARLEAERLLCHVLGIDRSELALTGGEELAPGEARRLGRLVGRRASGEPLQHIEGTVQFRDLVLLADPRAFIPRPETEQLVDWIEAWAMEASSSEGARARKVPLLERALDVGTGSGAIALSLAVEKIAARVVGLDVSPEALMQAAANRGAAGLSEEEVEFRVSGRPVWNAVASDERFDLVVSNPPYLTHDEMDRLPAQIRAYEPREALEGGEDGLDVIREISTEAASYLRRGGALFLEIGERQGEAVREVLVEDGAWSRLELKKDLAGRDRFVRAERD